MDLDALGNIAEAVGAAAVVVSLVYLVIQIRQNTQSIRSATYQSIVSAAASCNQTISQSSALARIMRLGSTDPSALDEDEQVQFSFLCMQFFDIFENLHLQHEGSGLADEYWEPRRKAFLALFEHAGFSEQWDRHRDHYTASFREVVEGGLGAVREEAPRTAEAPRRSHAPARTAAG